MEEKQSVNERETEWSGATPSLESPRQLQLTALLKDVMEALGQVKAAQKLGIDRKTLWRCRKKGRLTPRLSAALERLLMERELSAAMKQGGRVTELERQVTGLQGELRRSRKDAEGRSDGLREEHARGMRYVERRLVALEAGRNTDKGASLGGEEPDAPKRRYVPPRTYPKLVTLDAEPDEGQVYGDATPVIVEWRKAKNAFSALLKTGTELEQEEARIRMLKVEIALIEKHELTLPPAAYPWGREDRREQVRRREGSLGDAVVDRNRALLRRWLRRILTFGLWRN